MYNPCQYCGELPQVKTTIDVPLCVCNCGNTSFEQYWNLNNPLPEIDKLADLEQQLAECHQLLETLSRSQFVNWALRDQIKALLAKHQAN